MVRGTSVTSVTDIDRMVLTDNTNWSSAKRTFLENVHSSMPTSNIRSENHLIYVRALSRVLVDHMTSKWNEGRKDENVIHLMASGSTNITSDYDVAMVGNGASRLAKEINETFEAQTTYSLSEYADTNLYMTPYVSLTAKGVKRLGHENVLEVKARRGKSTTGLYIVVPTAENGGLSVVFDAAVYRLRESQHMDPAPSDRPIAPPRDHDMYKLASEYERLIYSSDRVQWKSVWDVATQVQIISPDAYYSVATILVVVVEMQMFPRTKYDFPDMIYRASAIENTAELVEWGLLPLAIGKARAPDDGTIAATVKYVYRVFYSMGRCVTFLPRDTRKIRTYLEVARVAEVSRGDATFLASGAFQKYKTRLPTMLRFIHRHIVEPYSAPEPAE